MLQALPFFLKYFLSHFENSFFSQMFMNYILITFSFRFFERGGECVKVEKVRQITDSGTNQHVCPLFTLVARNTLFKG